jgi:hypothetical protein
MFEIMGWLGGWDRSNMRWIACRIRQGDGSPGKGDDKAGPENMLLNV